MRGPDLETLVCSLTGHVTPAAAVRHLRPRDAAVGVNLGDGRRLSRCLRCDARLVAPAPACPERDVLPAALLLPRRGRTLRDAVVLRLVAAERAFHALLAGAVACALFALDLRWPAVRGWARHTADALGGSLAATDPTRQLVVKELRHLAGLRPGTLTLVAGAAAALSCCATSFALAETADSVSREREPAVVPPTGVVLAGRRNICGGLPVHFVSLPWGRPPAAHLPSLAPAAMPRAATPGSR